MNSIFVLIICLYVPFSTLGAPDGGDIEAQNSSIGRVVSRTQRPHDHSSYTYKRNILLGMAAGACSLIISYFIWQNIDDFHLAGSAWRSLGRKSFI